MVYHRYPLRENNRPTITNPIWTSKGNEQKNVNMVASAVVRQTGRRPKQFFASSGYARRGFDPFPTVCVIESDFDNISSI